MEASTSGGVMIELEEGRDVRFYFSKEQEDLRREVYDIGLDHCFDPDLTHEHVGMLIDMLYWNFPDHHHLGLAFWKRMYERLRDCTSMKHVLILIQEWIFTDVGQQCSNTSSKVSVMAAILFIGACRNLAWSLTDGKEGIRTIVNDKYHLMHLIVFYAFAKNGLCAWNYLGDNCWTYPPVISK